jgi:hypothetical protein
VHCYSLPYTPPLFPPTSLFIVFVSFPLIFTVPPVVFVLAPVSIPTHPTSIMADEVDPQQSVQRRPSMSLRDRRPSTSAPLSDLQGPVGPDFSRPKHKRTATGFGPADIKAVQSSIPEPQRAAYVYLYFIAFSPLILP